MQIADALQMPPAGLLPTSQKHASLPRHRAPAILQDPVGMDVVRAWDKVQPDERIAIRNLVDAMATRRARNPRPLLKPSLRRPT
jgi:hypothetical protein